jgi:hypothetical protein
MQHHLSFRRSALTLALLAVTTLLVQASSTLPGTQIPAGSTAALGSGKPAASSTSTPQGKILQSALNRETRKTLQEAMDSMDVSTPSR